jgi:hypothetical protein
MSWVGGDERAQVGDALAVLPAERCATPSR